MIHCKKIIMNDLEMLYYYNSDILKDNLREISLDYISNIILNSDEYWEQNQNKIIEKLGKFSIYSNYEPKTLFFNSISNIIDDEFEKLVIITENFHELLEFDYYYYKYFNWFKRFFFYFLNSRNVTHFHADCLYDIDIDEPIVKYIQINIFLPYDDFDRILDLMEDFLIEQEEVLKSHINNYVDKEKILEKFQKTYFVFKSLYE